MKGDQTFRRDIEFAGLTDEDSGEIRALIGGRGEIWVPTEVRIGKSQHSKNNRIESILYPIWDEQDEKLTYGSAKKLGRVLPAMPSSLRKAGWKKISKPGSFDDFKKLPEDFIRLENGSPEKIKEFVLKWGPLWWCTKHRDCCWQPYRFLKPQHKTQKCEWMPAEAIEDFKQKAGQVRAAMQIGARLLDERRGTSEHWEALGHEVSSDIETQRFFLALIINRHLSMWDGFGLWVRWGRGSLEGKLSINTCLGFFPVVWLQVAQALGGARGLYICDDCGEAYIRFRRKPREDRHNFCERCAKNERGTKKLSAQKAREKNKKKAN